MPNTTSVSMTTQNKGNQARACMFYSSGDLTDLKPH